MRAGAALALLGLAGCSLAPRPEVPATVVALPEAYERAAEPTGYEARAWWRSFGDPVLDRLVATALEANLDVAEAVARLEEAEARYRISRAPLFPAVDAGAEANRQSQPANTGIGGQFGGGQASDGDGDGDGDGETPPPGFAGADRFEFTTWSTDLSFAYEVDFWGRLRGESAAGRSEFLATASDLETARIEVAAATISTYLEIRLLDRDLALAEETADLLRERSELTDERYRRGLVTSFELYAIRQRYRNAQQAVPAAASRLEAVRGRLAVLLGRYAGRIDELVAPEAALDPDPGPVPAELPAALLVQRPDVRAQALRLEAARYRIGARRGDLFPALRLTGTLGLQAGDPDELLDTDQRFSGFVASLLTPIFQGGRLRASLDAAHARYRAQAAVYARTVLTAFAEVETSLYDLDRQRERRDALAEGVASARASVDLQLRRYLSGVGDYLAYLDARTDLATAELQLAGAERSVAEARLAVHRALGGDWVEGPAEAAAAVERYLEAARPALVEAPAREDRP